MFDLLIKNGRIIDGTGNPWFRADVGIEEGKIRAIGPLMSAEATPIIPSLWIQRRGVPSGRG